MGMDVYGKAATTEEGGYFRNNVWWWHPLAHYIEDNCPDLHAKAEHWHSNDGDGLGAEDSLKLAEQLQGLIDSGHTQAFNDRERERLKALPDESCKLCEGTGSRREIPNSGAGDTGKCNGCDSTGKVRPFETHYPFSVENVQEFTTFLKGCGGFEIC